jgi:hypothetical protein
VKQLLATTQLRHHSLRSSSSGVGFLKNAIQGFIISSEIWKAIDEGCAHQA